MSNDNYKTKFKISVWRPSSSRIAAKLQLKPVTELSFGFGIVFELAVTGSIDAKRKSWLSFFVPSGPMGKIFCVIAREFDYC